MKTLLIILGLVLSLNSFAGEGHDDGGGHGTEPKPTTPKPTTPKPTTPKPTTPRPTTPKPTTPRPTTPKPTTPKPTTPKPTTNSGVGQNVAEKCASIVDKGRALFGRGSDSSVDGSEGSDNLSTAK